MGVIVTSRPPDVTEGGQPCEPSPEAVARSVKRLICQPCCEVLNPLRAERGLAPMLPGPEWAQQ